MNWHIAQPLTAPGQRPIGRVRQPNEAEIARRGDWPHQDSSIDSQPFATQAFDIIPPHCAVEMDRFIYRYQPADQAVLRVRLDLS